MRLGLRARVLVVEAGQRLPVRLCIDKPTVGYLTRDHEQMAAHWKKAIQPLPHANAGHLAVDHLGNPPNRDFAPRILSGRVELPITE